MASNFVSIKKVEINEGNAQTHPETIRTSSEPRYWQASKNVHSDGCLEFLLQEDLLGSGYTEKLQGLSRRERVRRNQRRFRTRQKERQKDADEQVAQLTAELEASRIGQVLIRPRNAGTVLQRADCGQHCQCSKPRACATCHLRLMELRAAVRAGIPLQDLST